MAPRNRTSIRKHLGAIKKAIADIEQSFGRVAIRLRHAERLAARHASGRKERKLRLTPKRRAQLKLQGRYMGYMRQLASRHQAQVKAVRTKRGIVAAIQAAVRLRKGSAGRRG